ncbi:MAG: thiamine pyrophosphate-binding protein [Clostridium sp.]|nr:thiamine pyrophosphate-binding protein [Clostridium sp.]
MTGADYIVNLLLRKGITEVYGYPGSAMMKLMDTMIQSEKISFRQNYHEQACAFAADGYARTTGEMSVLLVTSGPGAINALAGIADAYCDSIPMLCITGQDNTSYVLRNGQTRQKGFQDLNIASIAAPITKYSVMITSIENLAYEMEKAITIANTGRKGPVLVDIPLDIQFALMPDVLRHYEDKCNINSEVKSNDIEKSLEMIRQATRPLILAGGGIRLSGAVEEFRTFLDKTKIPMVATLNGLDCGSAVYGFSGTYGHVYANIALAHTDCLLVLGARLAKHQVGKELDKYTSAKIIHIDIDDNELERVLKGVLTIKCDIKQYLQEANARLMSHESFSFDKWWKQLDFWKRQTDFLYQESVIEYIRAISLKLSTETVVTADVGQNQMWVAQGISLKGNMRLLNSGGYGSMGFSLPAAIGASIARNNQMVVAFMGDGGFQMNIQELQYLKLNNPNIKCIIFNNNTLGMMKDVQRQFYNSHFCGSSPEYYQCVNVSNIAQAYGLKYYLVDLDSAWDDTSYLNNSDACLVECIIRDDVRLLNKYDVQMEYERYCSR